MDLIYKELKKFGKVKIEEPMAKHTTMKIGGPVKYFIEITSKQSLVQVLKFLDGEGVPYFILGGGSNLLVSDSGFEGVVLKIKFCDLKINDNLVEASAGCSTAEVAAKSVEANLTGFEWGAGIPGTIGGAVRGNAGAMGSDMAVSVKEVEVYADGEVNKYSNEDCEFGYRDSFFKRTGAVILSVTLELEKAKDKEGMKEVLKTIQYRIATQPQGKSSSGCTFKNYEVKESEKEDLKEKGVPQEFLDRGIVPTGWLVEHSNLKNKSVGNAAVSEKHCNFIVNLGGATSENIISLIEEIKEAVYNKFGVKIEEEIQII